MGTHRESYETTRPPVSLWHPGAYPAAGGSADEHIIAPSGGQCTTRQWLSFRRIRATIRGRKAGAGVNGKNYIVCIGAANLDIHGFSDRSLLARESNPGEVHRSAGGVARNIAENLSRLGHEVSLVTALGDDPGGRYLNESCEALGIDTSRSITVPGVETSTYISINDTDGDMALALSDMRILDSLTTAHLDDIADWIDGSSAIVIDAGLTPGCIRFIAERFRKKRVFVNPVSMSKCERMRKVVGKFHSLCMNQAEASELSGVSIYGPDDIPRAATALHQAGVERVFVTAGASGAWYRDGSYEGHIPAAAIRVRNANGAGDAFTAGSVHAELAGGSVREAARTGVAAASIALQSNDTVSESMSTSALEWQLQRM